MTQEQARHDLIRQGYARIPASQVPCPEPLQTARIELVDSFGDLGQDRFMGDGGSYRYRRFGRFRLDPLDLQLTRLEGTSLYQSRQDNPLNGGIVRTFQELDGATWSNPFLHHLIRFDWTQLPIETGAGRPWQVGVHQVRILAHPGEVGLPTPEGIHIDGEAFTVQHLVARHNIEGGLFRAYDEQRQPLFEWLQVQPFDSLIFTNRLLHDATPVSSQDGSNPGRREILLIDFDPMD